MEKILRARLLEEADIRRALARVAHEIIERNGHQQELTIIGIQRRGAPLARLIAENIQKFSDLKVELATVDITYFRDDLDHSQADPEARAQTPPCSLADKTVILVDDVIYTGRTVRAAMDAISSWGRPACIQLAVLIDRGHRELPLRGDYIGKNVPTAKSERIAVHIPPIDETMDVELYEIKKSEDLQ